MRTYRPQTGGQSLFGIPRSVNMPREVSKRRALQGPPLCFYLSTSSPNQNLSGWHKWRIDRSTGACIYGSSAAHLLLNKWASCEQQADCSICPSGWRGEHSQQHVDCPLYTLHCRLMTFKKTLLQYNLSFPLRLSPLYLMDSWGSQRSQDHSEQLFISKYFHSWGFLSVR